MLHTFAKFSSKTTVQAASQRIVAPSENRGFYIAQYGLHETIPYHERVLDHCDSPQNVGTLDKMAADVGTGFVGSPDGGEVIKLQIRVNPECGTIEQAVFKAFGCGSAIASCSHVTEVLQGMNIEQAGTIRDDDIAEYLDLPVTKLHCSALAERAIKAAIRDY